MTTPAFFARLSTAARARALRQTNRTRLAEAVQRAGEERTAARAALNELNNQLNSSRTELARLDVDAQMYPATDERKAHRSEVAARLARLTDDQPYADALHLAAEVVHESAILELAWLDRPDPVDAAAVTTAALLWHTAEVYTAATAPGYRAITSQRVHTDGTWRSREVVGAVSRARARSIVQNWLDRPEAYVLADPYGRLFVACPDWRMELNPTDLAPPHTEGDVLRAALAVYGFPAYDGGEGGFTWLSVPPDRHASEEETYLGLHFRIASGEDADRPASAHDDPWGLAVYDEDGDFLTILDPAPARSTLAQDCAHAARSVAAYARAQD
ncbi:hypothetical protein [Streptomyces sp. NPDC050428]|uniref:hypothetical protein n=1 Tax=Streptomyces sp. NPDC050428 TaxID=3155757 RepID=UPI00341FB14A